MSALGVLRENLGWFIYPLGAVLIVALVAASHYLWRRLCDAESLARGSWELDVLGRVSGIGQLAGMLGTIGGLVVGLSRVSPGDPGSVAHLIGALSISLWTTYAGIVIGLGCQFVLLAARLTGQEGA